MQSTGNLPILSNQPFLVTINYLKMIIYILMIYFNKLKKNPFQKTSHSSFQIGSSFWCGKLSRYRHGTM